MTFIQKNCVAFRSVVERLHRLPQKLVATRLVKPLLSRFVVLDDDACEQLIPHLLTPITGWAPISLSSYSNQALPYPESRLYMFLFSNVEWQSC